jgi:hypothetical protein
MDSAKQPEAHRRRIEKACVMLAAGKRRPWSFSISEVVQSRGPGRQFEELKWHQPWKLLLMHWRRDGKEDTSFILLHRNNLKLGSQGLKNGCSKFSRERDWMISNATKRSILRWIHLIFTVPIIGYVYSPFAELPKYAPIVRFVSIPVLILSGFWMYAGVFFAIIGVALWLGAYQLSGYGAAILSLVALFIARKIWLVIRARQSKRSA